MGRNLLGLFLIILGIVLGCYLGIWVMFVGGIIQFITALLASPISAYGLAVGIVKVMFAALVGWLAFFVCVAFGQALLN